MKSFLATLLAAAVFLAPTCQSPLETQISELHAASLKLGDEFAPKLEELVQRSNSINVQGRALTPEELEFTSTTGTIESAYATWKEDMENVAKKAPDKKRMEGETALNEAIVNLTQMAAKLQ